MHSRDYETIPLFILQGASGLTKVSHTACGKEVTHKKLQLRTSVPDYERLCYCNGIGKINVRGWEFGEGKGNPTSCGTAS